MTRSAGTIVVGFSARGNRALVEDLLDDAAGTP
jgi:hypothetical protein